MLSFSPVIPATTTPPRVRAAGRPWYAFVTFAFALSALVSACSGSAQPGQPITACPEDIVVEPPQLLYPIPGATLVPDNLGEIVLYAPTGTSLKTVLQQVTSGAIVATTPTSLPSPLPSPIASPAPFPSSWSALALTVPALHASTSYNVIYGFDDTQHCAPPSANIGSFTTQ